MSCGAPDRRGVVIWLTGLPSSGKSTLATRLCAELRSAGETAIVLDGDDVRAAMRPTPGYDEVSRDQFYETLAGLAALLARQGACVLVAATAHRRAYRARARSMAPAFVEVWIDTPLAECARRDTKGLYALSRSHGTTTMPGADLGYEPPLEGSASVRVTPDASLSGLLAQILEAVA